MAAISDEKWRRYYESHHAHVGLAAEHPLRLVEFEANFGRHLPPPPARVLEIGFGRGTTLEHLASRGYSDLHGWDISSDCVDEARRREVPATLVHADAIEGLAACEPATFDAILAKDLLEHLPRDSVVPFVEGLHRALAPGGTFIARLPNMANPLSVFLRYDDFTHTLGFTENSVRQVFTLGGFGRDDVRVLSDELPTWELVKRGLVGQLVVERVLGPSLRAAMSLAIRSQRKGPPEVGTLRLVVVARRALHTS